MIGNKQNQFWGIAQRQWYMIVGLLFVFFVLLMVGRLYLNHRAHQTSSQTLVARIQSQIAIHLKSSGDLLQFADLQKMFAESLDVYEDTDGSYYLGAKDNLDPSLKIDGYTDPACQNKARSVDAIACVKLRP